MENDVQDENLVEEHTDDRNGAHGTHITHIHFTPINSNGNMVKGGAPIR